MNGLPLALVEAFTEEGLAGNGAAVVLLEEPAPDEWMQAIAAGLKQSETAFLLPHGGEWLLRWFTPSCEVPLCGHATLASLLALRYWDRLAPGASTRFHSRSGPLPVDLVAGDDRRGRLQLPGGVLSPAPTPTELDRLLLDRLECRCEAFWTSPLGYAVALLPDWAPLAALAPLAGSLPVELGRGLVLMQSLQGSGTPQRARIDGRPADYQLRFFAPALGIDEDPVTGSAHALVAAYWCERLGRDAVVGWQCSDRPGGMVCEGTSSGMIRLSGSGFLLCDGTLRARPQNCGVGQTGWQLLAAGV
jgi:predicted PhzF superfamily epimerase YddE/YHI9